MISVDTGAKLPYSFYTTEVSWMVQSLAESSCHLVIYLFVNFPVKSIVYCCNISPQSKMGMVFCLFVEFAIS